MKRGKTANLQTDMKLLGQCLNELCDDWENVESLCSHLGIAPTDEANTVALDACLRRAVAEGLAEAFDFKENNGFVRHDGVLERTEKLWFFITERGRKILGQMPEEWFAFDEGNQAQINGP